MQIREVALDDWAQIDVVCRASNRDGWTIDMLAPGGDRAVLLAITEGEIVGIAKTHFHNEPDNGAPAGHYLGGIVVTPTFRRQGAGSALTRARLRWIWARSSTAYYFTNEYNTASISMHEALGF